MRARLSLAVGHFCVCLGLLPEDPGWTAVELEMPHLRYWLWCLEICTVSQHKESWELGHVSVDQKP